VNANAPLQSLILEYDDPALLMAMIDGIQNKVAVLRQLV
jgi:hypothetical protein